MQDPDFTALHPYYAWMRDYLASLAPAGQLPRHRDVDLLGLPQLRAFINLAEVIYEFDSATGGTRYRFRFRLVGGEQTTKAERQITGSYVEDAVLPKYVDRILTNMRATTDRRAPIYDRFPMPHPKREFIDSERVYFPLANDGKTVDMLLILNNYPGGGGLPDDPVPPLPSGPRRA